MMEQLSPNNKRLKQLKKYYELAKARKKDDIYLIEGKKMLDEADKKDIKEIYISDSYADEELAFWEKRYEVPIYIIEEHHFNNIVRTNTPQGIAAIVKRRHFKEDYFFDKNKCKNLILGERLQDPGNVGTIIRTAAAAGFDALILDNFSVDVYNPKCVSASMSGIYRLPVLYVDNITDTIIKLNSVGYQSVACVMNGIYRYDECSYPEHTAVLIGNEGKGLTMESIKAATVTVAIPMVKNMESLNAAVAAALMMYEVGKKYL